MKKIPRMTTELTTNAENPTTRRRTLFTSDFPEGILVLDRTRSCFRCQLLRPRVLKSGNGGANPFAYLIDEDRNWKYEPNSGLTKSAKYLSGKRAY